MIILLSETIVDVIVKVIIALAVIACIVYLQIFLSKRRAIWPGLIMPIVYSLFVIYTVIILMLPIFVNINEISFASVFRIIGTFLLYNVPTAVLLIIYWLCRKKMRRADQLAKMEIQDLH